MWEFVKFVHIIAGMVYFGLPFAFGRWFHSIELSHETAPRRDALGKMLLFSRLHLSLTAMVVLLTGGYLAHALGHWPLWLTLSLVALVASMGNLHANLCPALRRYLNQLDDGELHDEAGSRLRIRIAIFSATHHTLVTIMIGLMVFKPI